MIHKLILVNVSAFVERCKKRQCNSKYDCKLGDHCVGGFCKPQPGFCSSDGDCDKNQCCAKGNDQHGVCKSLVKPCFHSNLFANVLVCLDMHVNKPPLAPSGESVCQPTGDLDLGQVTFRSRDEMKSIGHSQCVLNCSHLSLNCY